MATDVSVTQMIMELNPVYYKGDLTLCEYDWYFDDIVLSYDKFYFIVEGECTIKINGVNHTASPGQLFLLPYNSTQSLYTALDKTVKKYWFHCTLPCRGKDVTELIQLPYFINVQDVPYVERLFQSILQAEKDMSLSAKLDQKADITRLLSYYIKMSESTSLSVCHDSKITYILSYIEDHLTDDLSLEELSGLLHFHPNYFIRFFKEAMGVTPMAYIHNLRIALARRLLLDEGATIQDIGARAGFQNPHYFSRYFKKITGLTPTEYQRLAIEKHTTHGIAFIKKPYRPDEPDAE